MSERGLPPEAAQRLQMLPDVTVELNGVVSDPRAVQMTLAILAPAMDHQLVERVQVPAELLRGQVEGDERDALLRQLRLVLAQTINQLLDRWGSEYSKLTAPIDPRTGHPVRFVIDADCPNCAWPERWYDTGSQRFGCNGCDYTSTERNE